VLIFIRATACSVVKTIELSALRKTKDPTWDGVDLTIWSATELSVGIFIASLPPLRKQFDKMFSYILPTTITGRSKTPGNSLPLYKISKQFSKPMGWSEDNDNGSEQHIIPDQLHIEGKITKTVVHEITATERDSTAHGPVRSHDRYGEVSG